MQFLGREITDVTIESMLIQQTGRAISGRKWTSSIKAQYWRFIITLQSSFHDSPQSAVRVFAHQAARGGGQQFQMSVPQPPVGNNTLGGKQLSQAAQGATRIGLSGIGAPVIDGGRFVKFSNHAKIYIVEDATATTLTIFPGLVAAVPTSTGMDFLPDMPATYGGLARLDFRGGRATPALIVEELI